MVIDNPARSAFAEEVERSPRATRVGRSRWLNPQVVVGLVLVLGATALGARLIAAADDTVPVLVAATDLRPGQPLTDDSVEVRRVRLDDALDRYHTGEVGTGYVVVRPVDQGELLPVSAIAAEGDGRAADVRYLSLSLPSEEVPRALVTGSSVDVWLTPADDAKARAATAVASGVTVSSADADAGALGIQGARTSITLAIGPAQTTAADDRTADEGVDEGRTGQDTSDETDSGDETDERDDGDESAKADAKPSSAVALDELIATLVGAARDGRVYLVLRPDAVNEP